MPTLLASTPIARNALITATRTRFVSTSTILRVEQAIKSTTNDAGKPANPSPPPRAAASTPQPGSQTIAIDPKQAEAEAHQSAAKVNPVPVHGELKKKVVRAIAVLMGYNTHTTTAIRVTSDLYDRCAERWDLDKEFWQGECHLPPTYQSWFQVTNIHVMLLLLRFRALEPKSAAVYQQEMINHFFIDAEYRMRQRFGVQTARLVKGYMKEMHTQHRGALLAVDEAVAMLDAPGGQGDTRIAMALWRNLFGAGWGEVGGVLSKVRGVDRSAKNAAKAKEEDAAGDAAQLAHDRGFAAEDSRSRSPYAAALAKQRQNAIQEDKVISDGPIADPMASEHPELSFPIVLSRLTKFFLRELRRLAAISDREVELGRVSRSSISGRPSTVEAPAKHIKPENVASVGAGQRAEIANDSTQTLGLDDTVEQTREGKPVVGEGKQSVGDQSSVASFGRP